MLRQVSYEKTLYFNVGTKMYFDNKPIKLRITCTTRIKFFWNDFVLTNPSNFKKMKVSAYPFFAARGGNALSCDKVHHTCHVTYMFPHFIGCCNISTDGERRHHNNHIWYTQPNIRISNQRWKNTEFIKGNSEACKYLVNPCSTVYCILDSRYIFIQYFSLFCVHEENLPWNTDVTTA